MRELFRKYLDNNCSPDEVRKLLAHFNIAENETMLRRLITESLEEDEEDEEEENRWQTNIYSTLELIEKLLTTEKIKVISIFNKTWFVIAAKKYLLIHLLWFLPAIQYHFKIIETNLYGNISS